MPWAGGSYTKGNNGTGGWVGDASLGIGIEAGRHDTQDNDFATGINQCINKDGSNAFTGDANLGGFKPTNMAAGTAAAPALCVGGDVNTGVFGPAADTWAVATNGTERIKIDSAGRVGIGGGTNTNYRLSVYGETSTASSHSFIALNNGGNTAFRIRDDGLINTGLLGNSPYNATTGAAANVHVGGGGDLLRSTSSLKYKTDIHDYTHGLNAVNALRPVFYKGINDGDKQFAGLIAEEVHEAGLTEFVVYNEQDEPDALHYGNMVALAFKAIQELNAKVEALEAQVAALTPAPVEEPEA